MANVLTPVAIWLGSLSWLPRFLRQITAVDKFLQRITRGRLSLVGMAGLPSMMMTVVGRKSGVARTTPVVCVPYGGGNLVAGSNFGGPKEPAWVLKRARGPGRGPTGRRTGRRGRVPRGATRAQRPGTRPGLGRDAADLAELREVRRAHRSDDPGVLLGARGLIIGGFETGRAGLPQPTGRRACPTASASSGESGCSLLQPVIALA